MGNLLTVAKRKNVGVPYPMRKTAESAGLDLHTTIDVTLQSLQRSLIPTGMFMTIPRGHYGAIHTPSAIALQEGVQVHHGVIDSDYTGEIFVLLFNLSSTEVVIKKGKKIAQIVISPYLTDHPVVLPDRDGSAPLYYRQSWRARSGFGVPDTQQLLNVIRERAVIVPYETINNIE